MAHPIESAIIGRMESNLKTKVAVESAEPADQRDWRAWGAVILLVLSAAGVPVLIRMAQAEGVPSISIIGIRLIMATAMLAPAAFRRHGTAIRAMTYRQWLLVFLAGAVHALGLYFLFFALEATTLMVNGVLRRLSPVFAILIETIFLGAVFSRKVWIGTFATLLGMALVVYGAVEAIDAGPRPFLGAILSIGSALNDGGVSQYRPGDSGGAAIFGLHVGPIFWRYHRFNCGDGNIPNPTVWLHPLCVLYRFLSGNWGPNFGPYARELRGSPFSSDHHFYSDAGGRCAGGYSRLCFLQRDSKFSPNTWGIDHGRRYRLDQHATV